MTNITNTVNGSGDINHNHQKELNRVKQKAESNGDPISPGVDELDTGDNNYLLENETFPEDIAPLTTPRSPEVEPKKPPRRSPAARGSPASTKDESPRPPPRRSSAEKHVSENKKPQGVMQRTVPSVQRKQVVSATGSSGKARSPRVAAGAGSGAGSGSGGTEGSCDVCGRHFAPERLQRHQDICRKTHAKKRKPFDVLKHRLAGTEAEPLINKLRKTNTNTSSTAKTKPLNGSWRQKHEEFIQAIRAAKQVQAHLNAGGKLSDLPPPPPSENPDYVQCPHCQRRFNSSAAERHIPKCASYQFNKPKPQPKKR